MPRVKIISDTKSPEIMETSHKYWGDLKKELVSFGVENDDVKVTLIPSYHTLSLDYAELPEEDFKLYILKHMNGSESEQLDSKDSDTKLSQ